MFPDDCSCCSKGHRENHQLHTEQQKRAHTRRGGTRCHVATRVTRVIGNRQICCHTRVIYTVCELTALSIGCLAVAMELDTMYYITTWCKLDLWDHFLPTSALLISRTESEPPRYNVPKDTSLQIYTKGTARDNNHCVMIVITLWVAYFHKDSFNYATESQKYSLTGLQYDDDHSSQRGHKNHRSGTNYL